ncbi:hypothetical protein [Pseudonocardia sp. McavD-2-B]|uniref:hypothetical protein n=1 Tax=Pseudonocardia sp. McavD-2-B TaxID=2954499 RepID=UPI0020968D64|nr:hypothetical protein [Pseudonocardia sp. McavD-2-B]MCO7196894.1 hypothetical protein [Pseudonocardia sp. McavD-2-B]
MAETPDEHDESLDAELARIQAEAEVKMAQARGRTSAGGTARAEDDEPDEPAKTPAKRSTKRAKAGKATPRDDEPDEGNQSWDEFWAAYQRRKAAERGEAATTVIRGVEVTVPHDLPLAFDEHVNDVEGSEDESDVERLVGELFGDDVFGQWKAAGMTSVEFQIVLLWGMANGKGNALTFAQAAEAVETEGKSLAPNRSARRKSAKAGR